MSFKMSRLTGLLVSAASATALLLAFGCPPAMTQSYPGAGPALLAQVQPAQPQPAQTRQNVEANIAELRKKLQITSAQEAQFNAVAAVMRDNARLEASAPQQPPANATALDDLRAYIKYSELELAGLKKMLPPLEALYAALSPTQRKTADAVFRQGPGG